MPSLNQVGLTSLTYNYCLFIFIPLPHCQTLIPFQPTLIDKTEKPLKQRVSMQFLAQFGHKILVLFNVILVD